MVKCILYIFLFIALISSGFGNQDSDHFSFYLKFKERESRNISRYLQRDKVLQYNKLSTITLFKTHIEEIFLLAEQVYQIDSIGTWYNDTKYIYNYDNAGRKVEEIHHVWKDTTWSAVTRYTRSYDLDGNIKRETRQTWTFGQWFNDRRNTNEYDSEGNLTETLWQEWKNFAWQDVWKDIYSYNQDGNPDTVLFLFWDGAGWINEWLDTYLYTDDGYLSEIVVREWLNDQWVNRWKDNYEYNDIHLLSELTWQFWDSGAWVNQWRGQYAYTIHYQIEKKLEQIWQSNTWINDILKEYTYNTAEQLSELLEQKWQNQQWVNFENLIFEYNQHEKLDQDIRFAWETNAWIRKDRNLYSYTLFEDLPVIPEVPILISPSDQSIGLPLAIELRWSISDNADYYRFQMATENTFGSVLIDTSEVRDTVIFIENLDELTTYFWRVKAGNDAGSSEWSDVHSFTTKQTTSVVDGNSDIALEFKLEQNYPNPFNPSTTIRYTIPALSHVRLDIYNAIGQHIESLVNEIQTAGEYVITFNASDLASGFYIYKLRADEELRSRKLLIIK